MENTVYVKNYTAPPVDMREVVRYSGSGELTEDTKSLFEECISEIEEKLLYKVCYRELPVTDDGNCVKLGELKITSKDIRKNLCGCSCAIVFAATVGIIPDRLIAKYSIVSPAKALLFQAIGAERIETLCDIFCDEIKTEKATSGKTLRPRFSPGYGDFPIEEQKSIFNLLDPSGKIGLTLNDSLIMSPTKSVTAIMGVCDMGKETKKHSCKDCSQKNCEFRRTI